MSSDEGQEELDENPMVIRHRKEKKELRAKITAMKKSSKSGNKKQQKEAKEQMEKLEKELEDRQKQERDEQMTGNEFLLTSISGPPPSQTGEKIDTDSGGSEDGQDSDGEAGGGGGGGFAGKVYKKLKISKKKQKFQEKKKNRAESMQTAVGKDKERGDRNEGPKAMEKVQIKALLQKNQLRMVDIPADGDCMYQSVSHQLLEEGIEISVRKLRKACANYMREHREELEPFISDTDNASAKGTEGLSVWDRYLLGVENMADVAGGAWGGEMELKVVSEIYRKTILIYSVGSDTPHKIGEQFESPKDRPLRLVYLRHAYTLGEHYNSVVFV